eukprot:GFKZ01011005.1.p1 GENE.GFKZ01011005.1~~GFKZ01011005.1.p1  ORF type:complete len:237 (+),score=6.63 GFKZ01011005.1:202-912(+)
MRSSTANLLSLLFLTSTLLHVSLCGSLTFELPYGQRKCFSEDLPPYTVTRGTVHVSSGSGEMSLDLFVSDQNGVVQFHKSDVNTVKFSFRSGSYPVHTRQMYRFCVVNQVHAGSANTMPGSVTRRVTLKVEPVYEGEMAGREQHQSDGSGTAVSRLAKQGHVDKVYQSFLEVSNDVDGLIERMEELRAEEEMLTAANERTAGVILKISVVACTLTIATGVLNFLSLKSFFKRKKLA